jgi:glutaconate CoA-transferase subunit A
MAAVHEVIRQRVGGLHLYAHSNGQGVDELVGAGCVRRLEIAYGGNGRFAPTCIRFRKAVQERRIEVEDYSNYQMTLRFLAGAMGVPFLPTRSSLGTDIINRWGFSESLRRGNPELPDQKLVVLDNPFEGWMDTSKVVLVPAIQLDTTILHVQEADRSGTARIRGLTFADVEQAKCARHLILTCEVLVKDDTLRLDPDQNQLPGIIVDAVIPVALGAYPTACYRYYDYDPVFLNYYRDCAQDDTRYRKYLEEYIYGTDGHEQLLDKIDADQLRRIEADPRTGYAVGLDRR